jgi:Uma2 family endonuclease
MKTLIKWSVEDYHRMIEAGILADRRVELLEGDIVAVSPEKPEHYFLSDETSDYLKERLQGKAVVRLDGPITLATSEPEPDIAIVRLPKAQYRDRHPHPADIYWIIEYSDSSLATDLEEKRRIYATAAIPEYWVVTLKARHLRVFQEPVGDTYQKDATITTGLISPLAFPDVTISVERILGIS